KVRELLLWRTYGGMINAAVLGLFGPLRYILLTDALLDTLDKRSVEAIMAHELGHVKKKHMFWLLLAAITLLGLLEIVFGLLFAVMLGGLSEPAEVDPMRRVLLWPFSEVSLDHAVMIAAVSVTMVVWFFAFGWVSRRIERQADTFAVRHMAEVGEQTARDELGRQVIDAQAAESMVHALRQVAELNHVPPQRKSWRHGSIAWRQDYLRSLVGKRLDALPIDRTMRWVNTMTLAGFVLMLVLRRVVMSLQETQPLAGM
ncbi:MAG: M48 family metalloprotease, partial [Rhodospirillales bacterium]|nr:M48 family metalloprotease [Rhodospirillales bacterium]